MSDPEISAKVYVKVTLEIAAEGRWGHDCQVAQVHKQAVSGVLDVLNSPEAYARLIVSGKIKIVGAPIVAMVLAESHGTATNRSEGEP
jgi:hypothetical protein